MKFIEDYIYLKSSKYSANSISKFLKRINVKINKLEVLDFGCGPCTMHKFLNFKKVYLYDINNFTKPKQKNKYVVIKNYNSIFKNKKKYDLIILNSVIQYIKPNILINLLKSLKKKLKQNGIIFLGDIPKSNRILEILMSKNLKKIYYLFKYFLLNRAYYQTKYYLYKELFFKKKFRKDKIIFFSSNSYFFKGRYCVVIKK